MVWDTPQLTVHFPGTTSAVSKRQIELVLWTSANRMSIPLICWFSALGRRTKTSRAKHASSGRSSRISSSFATRASTRRRPCGTIPPYTAECARKAKAAIVLCRTRNPRALCSIRNAWSSRDLTGTKRMLVRVTASQMAAASEASFLAPHRTKGLT